MENITPGYYWAKQKKYKNAEIEIVEVYEAYTEGKIPPLAVSIMGSDDFFYEDDFEIIQRIEIPEEILDKLDERDYEDNKRPTPSLQ